VTTVFANESERVYVVEQAHGRTEGQMIGALKQNGGGKEGGRRGARSGRPQHTLYASKAKCDVVSQTQEAKQLRDENTWLQKRKLVADFSLGKEALQSVIRRYGWSCGLARGMRKVPDALGNTADGEGGEHSDHSQRPSQYSDEL
jgi:hypothetical protein